MGINNAHAWYDHTAVQYWVATEFNALMGKDYENNLIKRPSILEQQAQYETIAALLLLNPEAKLKSLEAKTLKELITMAAEDPDHGIDKNLPDSADPNNDRKWMGGLHHPGTQGFRHMVFQGFQWSDPLTTLQYPARLLGQAHDRFDLMARESKKRFQEKDIWWATRILGWALHYIQDLTQPFHAVQIPSLKMIPWYQVLVSNPLHWFETYLTISDRTITNYHWAYEGYIRNELLKKESSVFKDCFKAEPEKILVSNPRELALQIANESKKTSLQLGSVIVDFFGKELQSPEINFPKGTGKVDDAALNNDPTKKMYKERLIKLSCDYFKRASSASTWIVSWALHP